MVVKTFRGQLADGGQDRIRLSTIKGKVGYKIVKFQVMATDGDQDTDPVVKIYKKEQSSIVSTVNFTDSDLLACALLNEHSSSAYQPTPIVIFDNEIFNQDIYISQKGASYSLAVNYYLELEVIPLDDAGAEYTTLKDMRQS